MPKELANTQDLVAIEEVRQNTVVLKDGGLRQIIMVGGINFALKSEEEQNVLIRAYQNFLNSLDYPVQIVIHSRKINIENYLNLLEKRIEQEPSELLRNQIVEYREFIRNFVQGNPIMVKTFLVVVPFSPLALPSTSTLQRFIPFLKKRDDEKQKALEEQQQDFQKNLEQLEQRVNQVTQGLQAIDLEARVLENEELIELFYNFYNPGTIEKEKINLPEQAADKN